MLGARLLVRVRSLRIASQEYSKGRMIEMLICTNTVCIPWNFTDSVQVTRFHVSSRSLLVLLTRAGAISLAISFSIHALLSAAIDASSNSTRFMDASAIISGKADVDPTLGHWCA